MPGPLSMTVTRKRVAWLAGGADPLPGTSSVTVYAAGGFCNVENHGGNTPEHIAAMRALKA